ncbi:MAG: hypothetical protein JO061_02375 [Acidobacteriaceae bacterium]|nr:hypothetical protein [Acidobacteriaceae bacterium]
MAAPVTSNDKTDKNFARYVDRLMKTGLFRRSWAICIGIEVVIDALKG